MDINTLVTSPIIHAAVASVVFNVVLRASDETRSKWMFFEPRPDVHVPFLTEEERSLFRDCVLATIFAIISATVNTQVWPRIWNEPRPGFKVSAFMVLITAALDIPLLILDRHHLWKGVTMRLRGGLVPLTTIWAVVRTTITPWLLIAATETTRWLWKPSKIKTSALNKILRPCAAPDGEMCGICKDDEFENPVELPCRHIFCDDCIRLALRSRSVCPICGKQYGQPGWLSRLIG